MHMQSLKRLAFAVAAVGLPAATAGAAEELFVANHSIQVKVYPHKYQAPAASSRGLELRGVRNGRFAGQLLASSFVPMEGIKAAATALTGAGTIPAKAITIRWGVLDGARLGQQLDVLQVVGCFVHVQLNRSWSLSTATPRWPRVALRRRAMAPLACCAT